MPYERIAPDASKNTSVALNTIGQSLQFECTVRTAYSAD